MRQDNLYGLQGEFSEQLLVRVVVLLRRRAFRFRGCTSRLFVVDSKAIVFYVDGTLMRLQTQNQCLAHCSLEAGEVFTLSIPFEEIATFFIVCFLCFGFRFLIRVVIIFTIHVMFLRFYLL